MCDAVLLKPVEEWCRCVFNFRLLHHDNTLEIRMDTTRFKVGTNCNVGVVSRTMFWVINTTKSLVEEIIEALVYVICLAHHHCMTFYSGMANSCNCIDLEKRNTLCYTKKTLHTHIIL